MTIDMMKSENALTLKVSGRLDTTTSPEFEEKALSALEEVELLVLDASELQYVSSAGLRAILTLQKTMNKQGKMKLTNVNDAVMEVFKMTGFADILTIG